MKHRSADLQCCEYFTTRVGLLPFANKTSMAAAVQVAPFLVGRVQSLVRWLPKRVSPRIGATVATQQD
jgi:hypothetical protein